MQFPASLVRSSAQAFSVGELVGLELQPGQQEQALSACFREDWSGASKRRRILLPVRNLQQWIEQNIMLILKEAPFNKRDMQLVSVAGNCIDCPKRTGHNILLFSDLGKQDACTDPTCYHSKVNAHVAQAIAAKPQLVQISTAYGMQKEGSPVIPRNKYIEVRKPASKEEAKRPEFKVCKFTTEAIITEGSGVGIVHKVCATPSCPVHHPTAKPQKAADDAKWKAEQEKERRDQAIANATGLRVLSAIGAVVPVRLLKRDLFFVLEKLIGTLDEPRVETLARQHGIRQKRDEGGIVKTLLAFMRRADEGMLSRLTVEATILLAASRHNGTSVLKDAAMLYKVDTEAIGQKVKQEFAAKAKKQPKPEGKLASRITKAA